MSAAGRLVRAIAATLPEAARDRYREEWVADLAGAAEQGLGRSSIVVGALAVAATIDRADPAVSGMGRGALALRRARWAAAFLGVGMVLGVGMYLHGGWPDYFLDDGLLLASFVVLSRALLYGGAAALVIGILLLVVAISTALPWRPPLGLLAGAAAAAGGAVVLGVVLVGSMLWLLFFPLLAVLVWAVLALLVPAPAGSRARGRGILPAALLALLVLVLVAVGLLHITVWDPLAKLPGMTLDEIYAGLAAAGELPTPVPLVLWAGSAVLAAIGVLLFAALPHPRLRAARSPRRVVVLGLSAVAGTAFSMWVAGFGMGMGIADAFAASGAAAAPTQFVLVLLGVGVGIPAVLLGTVPGPRPAASAL